MPKEIERKFLIWENGVDYSWIGLGSLYTSVRDLRRDILARGALIKQGYLPAPEGKMLAEASGLNVNFEPAEARLRSKGGKYTLTVKGSGGLSRNELEKAIPKEIFDRNWPQTEGKRVEKKRMDKILSLRSDSPPISGTFVVEFDAYIDRDLILAEVELEKPDENQLNLLDWNRLGLDVTEDSKYKNRNLAK